jgi:hypothetical protein
MTLRQRIVAALGALIFYGLVLVDALDRARKFYEAPNTTLTIAGAVRRIWSELTPPAWIVLILGTTCLLVATSDWWRPWASKIVEFVASPRQKSGGGLDASLTKEDQPSYWTLCETVTWIAFGKTATKDTYSAEFLRERHPLIGRDACHSQGGDGSPCESPRRNPHYRLREGKGEGTAQESAVHLFLECQRGHEPT